MNIEISLITAYMLRDHCSLSPDLLEQIGQFPVKADIVVLNIQFDELSKAYKRLQEFVAQSPDIHMPTYQYSLKELGNILNED